MKSGYDRQAHKRPVNLTPEEDTTLLARSKAIDAMIAIWNEFNTNSGSIADEYSSL
jgi:hypothetical protein